MRNITSVEKKVNTYNFVKNIKEEYKYMVDFLLGF